MESDLPTSTSPLGRTATPIPAILAGGTAAPAAAAEDGAPPAAAAAPAPPAPALPPAADANGIARVQAVSACLTVDGAVLSYAAALVRRTRGFPGLHLGGSPRAGVALIAIARALALARGRGFVVPEDIQDAWLPCLRHRVIVSAEAEVEGRHADAILGEVLAAVPAPGARAQ